MKWLKITGILIIVVVVIIAVSVKVFLVSKSPDYDGSYVVSAIHHEARIVRDSWGVPHITADNGEDAYFAYGFAVAQDRLFQMELQRRLARGELAEILGPKLIDVDKRFRTLMLRRKAEEYLADPGRINPEALKLTDAFLSGINYFVETQDLPVEFTLLGFKPAAFTRVDSVVMLGYMAFNFVHGLENDSVYGMIKEKVPDIDMDELFPGYSRQKPVTIMETSIDYNKGDSISCSDEGGNNIAGDQKKADGNGDFIKENDLIIQLRKAFRLSEPLDGSNSWVIAPSRSASGKAILGNDPHVGLSNPGIWYEAHISYGDYGNYGYHIALVPFPMLGHNKYRGWTVTMFENDDCDLYYETINEKNRDLVMYKGSWTRLKRYRETIAVKGGDSIEYEVAVTPHGPIVSDFIKGYKDKPVSMQWVHLQNENPVLDAAYAMSVANDMESFEKAIAMIANPGFNVSYADSKGNIAWWAVGKLPMYRDHVNTMSILDGSSGRDDIIGYLPFRLNPRMKNPASGIIVTANNMSTVKPLGPMKKIAAYWVPTDRAARIIELLRSKEKWSLEELQKIQTDMKSQSAQSIVKEISRILEGDGKPFAGMSGTEREAFSILKSWNGINTIDSPGAAIFHMNNYHITSLALRDELGEDLLKQYASLSEHWNFYKVFIKDEESRLWDDRNTGIRETRRDVITRAFSDAVAEGVEKMGSDPNDWRWGRLHTIEFAHPLGIKKPLNIIFNLGPYEAPGAFRTVNRFGGKFGNHDYKVTSVPSTRRLIDYGNMERSFAVLPSGNSGNSGSAYYDDQVDMYLKGEYRIINFSSRQIEEGKKHEIIFKRVP